MLGRRLVGFVPAEMEVESGTFHCRQRAAYTTKADSTVCELSPGVPYASIIHCSTKAALMCPAVHCCEMSWTFAFSLIGPHAPINPGSITFSQ